MGYTVCIFPGSWFMGPTWSPSGANRTQAGPLLAPWTLLSGSVMIWHLPTLVTQSKVLIYLDVAMMTIDDKSTLCSGNGLVPSGNKPLPESMLTHISCHHIVSPDHSELICTDATMIATIFHLMVDLGQLYEGIIWCLSHTAINTPSHLYSWAGLCNIGFASPMAPW